MRMVFPESQATIRGGTLHYYTRVRQKLLDGTSTQVETAEQQPTGGVRDHAGLAGDHRDPAGTEETTRGGDGHEWPGATLDVPAPDALRRGWYKVAAVPSRPSRPALLLLGSGKDSTLAPLPSPTTDAPSRSWALRPR